MSKECEACGNERVMVCLNCDDGTTIEMDASRIDQGAASGGEKSPIQVIDDLRARIAALEAENKRLADEVKSIPKAWPDDVPLAGPNRPANDGTTAWLIGYLLTVLKRFGNTCVTADLQWGATALHVAHKEREENKRLTEERDGWKREAKLSRTILEELKKQKEYEIANKLIPGGSLLCSAMGSLCHQLLDVRAANDARKETP